MKSLIERYQKSLEVSKQCCKVINDSFKKSEQKIARFDNETVRLVLKNFLFLIMWKTRNSSLHNKCRTVS